MMKPTGHPVAWRIWRSDRWCFGYSETRDFYRTGSWQPLFLSPEHTALPAGLPPTLTPKMRDAVFPKWTYQPDSMYADLLAAAPGGAQSLSPAARDVLVERERQVSAEGWTPDHDDNYVGDQLAEAAACYITGRVEWGGSDNTQRWPWAIEWWKPGTRRRDLVKAAALLIAEIERLDRYQGAIACPDNFIAPPRFETQGASG